MLLDWAGAAVFRDALTLYERGAVLEAKFDAPYLAGTLSFGNRTVVTRARVHEDGTCENLCPCRDSTERGIICAHVIAVGLALVRRHSDPERERRYAEEQRKAARMARFGESAFLKRVTSPRPDAQPARLLISLEPGWQEACRRALRESTTKIPIRCDLESRQQRWLLDEAPRDAIFLLSKKDENLLFVLEDISEGPARGRLEVSRADLCNILSLCVGKAVWDAETGRSLTIHAAPVTSALTVSIDEQTGELRLYLETPHPFASSNPLPVCVVAGTQGWLFDNGHAWPLENPLPEALHELYLKEIRVPRESVPRFFQVEWASLGHLAPTRGDVSLDMFTLVPATPAFRLVARGSRASISATLYAVYGGRVTLVAGKEDGRGQFALPDPEDLLRYEVRNMEAEKAALKRLAESGFCGETGDQLSPLVGCREVLNFLGCDMPALRRAGWEVVLEGPIGAFAESSLTLKPVVHLREEEGRHWFEMDVEFQDGVGGTLTAAEVQRALRKGEAFIERNGRTILLDTGAIESLTRMVDDCGAAPGDRPGSYRLAGIFAGFVQSSLQGLSNVSIDAAPAWWETARKLNRELSPPLIELPSSLESVLRPYQKEGVRWLRFLEQNGFCGILADEMGLGKTVQALAWLALPRVNSEAQGLPSLIVCPTSLVENWLEEAARFAPWLKVMAVAGSERHEKWGEVGRHDLIVTSYALLRRDIDQYVNLRFACLVLDEAQHIKNRSTQNAIAAKRIRAHHRLVLTGTPMENNVSDLWSIMDFLMPGYLGSHDQFRASYELPISRGDRDGELAQQRLRRKLHPFLLRRLKREVATDLPPKMEKIAFCSLTPDQKTVYKELLETSRRRVFELVMKQGFQRSRMEILKTLMRLRQVCCHLELLKLEGLESAMPSGKMELFFELLDEVLDGGHRALVFSQFTSMLAILRRELEARGLRYCYLDGATQERLKIVHAFNSDREIPVFLISLKAGGTGLNLVGADTVIHYDPWWNPAVEEQATDRAYRIGQKRTVYSLKLITKGTVEEKVLEMQQRKKALIEATLVTDEQVMGALTWEDIREILNL